MQIDHNVTFVRSTSPAETTVGSEIVLMTLESGECFGLGETGSDVWRLLRTPIQLAPLVEALGEIYDAPATVIEQDVVELLGELRDRGLIEVNSDT